MSKTTTFIALVGILGYWNEVYRGTSKHDAEIAYSQWKNDGPCILRSSIDNGDGTDTIKTLRQTN